MRLFDIFFKEEQCEEAKFEKSEGEDYVEKLVKQQAQPLTAHSPNIEEALKEDARESMDDLMPSSVLFLDNSLDLGPALQQDLSISHQDTLRQMQIQAKRKVPSEVFMKEVLCEETKFEKSENEDVTANEERLKRSDLVIDIVASSIIRLSDTVHNSESVPESVRMNGKAYDVVDNQEEWKAKLDILKNCINSDKPLLPNEIKPILLVNPKDPKDSYFYVPIATDAQSPPRGIYLKVDTPRKDSQPIGSFITASCLFGSKTLVGIDAAGKQYPLLDTTKNPVPEGVHIIEVRVLNETHTYECAMWETDKIIVPFIKQHKNAKQKVTHLLADVEYYLYGLTYLVGGIFSREAFEQYITAVNVRVAKHKEKMREIYAGSGITLNFNVNSPFRNLELSGKSAEEVIDTFIRLFSDKGVKTLEDLCSSIRCKKITFKDLLVKLKESFNSDSAIAACEIINNKDQQIIKRAKAKAKAKKLDSNSEVLKMLDEVAKYQRDSNMETQDKLNPWRMENFEPEVRNLVEGKENDPTPSKMFSIVSTLSEVARVMMSVIQNRNKLVCLIFESQQKKTLKKFKKLFAAHSKKICAYVYQLPIATQDRPLFHVEDCPAVTGDLISTISKLCYLNGVKRIELKLEVNKYLAFCNSHYDTYLLNYICSHYPDGNIPVTGGRISEYKQKVQTKILSGFFFKIIDESIMKMRHSTGLYPDKITDEQIIIMLVRLAKYVVWDKNREFNQPNNSKDPRIFYYTDGDTTSDHYKKNGPKKEEFHLRNIFQFSADAPLLNKKDRISLLKNISLLEYVNGNVSETILEFKFRSRIILTFLSMIKDDNKFCSSETYVIDKLFVYYVDLVLAVQEVDETISMENIFIEKLGASTLPAARTSKANLVNVLRDFPSKLPNIFDFKPIVIFNLINIASELGSFTLSTILNACGSFRDDRIKVYNEKQEFYAYNQFPINISLKQLPVNISLRGGCKRIARNVDMQSHLGEYIITEADAKKNLPDIYIRFGDDYVCILKESCCGIPVFRKSFKFDSHKEGYSVLAISQAGDIIRKYVRMSKKISIDNNCGITLYIEDGNIDYVKLYPGRAAHFKFMYRKRVGFELERLSLVYFREQSCREDWWPISRLVNQISSQHVLSQGLLCNTFIQNIATEQEVQLLPIQALLAIRINKDNHASLFVQWVDEKGVVCFEKFEIGVGLEKDREAYCHLSHRKEYSESTSDQHLKEALGRFVINMVQAQSEYPLSYEEYLDSTRWFTIISTDELIKMKKHINAMFYAGSPQEENKLLYPFSRLGKVSVGTIGEAQRKFRLNNNLHGEMVAPINCFDFCREAVFATGNAQARNSFPANLWVVSKIVNTPWTVKKATKAVQRLFPHKRVVGDNQRNKPNPNLSPNPN